MADWQPIETAPKDGTVVHVRRVAPSGMIFEGPAVWDVLAAAAPSRQGAGPDPLGRLSASDYARENDERAAWTAEPKWLKPDRLYAFPTPTEWLPD